MARCWRARLACCSWQLAEVSGAGRSSCRCLSLLEVRRCSQRRVTRHAAGTRSEAAAHLCQPTPTMCCLRCCLPVRAAGFAPSQAVALSNITILGGALSNFMFNSRRRHPSLNRPLIDWDLTLVMEPTTMLGALLGGYLNKVRRQQRCCAAGRCMRARCALRASAQPSSRAGSARLHAPPAHQRVPRSLCFARSVLLAAHSCCLAG